MSRLVSSILQGDAADVRSKLAFGIQRGRVGSGQVHRIIEEIKADPERKELLRDHSVFKINYVQSEWSEEYLRNIGEAIVCGDMSEELLYHMAEVSRYVNRRCMIMMAATGILFVVIVIIFVLV